MGRRRFSDTPPPPDDLRCRRSDGRDWRCPQPSLPGLSLCVYHHRRSYKNPNPGSSPSPGPSSNPPPATPPTSADEKKPWKLRIRNPKRPASPSEEGGAMETPKSERTEDQKSSQRRKPNPDPPTSPPSEETANGNTKMTPIVLALVNSKGTKDKDEDEPEEMQSEGTERRRRRAPRSSQTETPTPVPVDSERCKRSDGRGWQCKAKASPGVGYCEHHYKRVKLLKDLRMKKNALGGSQGRKKLSAAAVAAAVKRHAEKQQQVVTHASPENTQEETMLLPKGLMTISPMVGSAVTVRGSVEDKKVGVDSAPIMVRPIRSKNCPPEPVGPVKVLPLGGKGIKKDRKRTCHRCGEAKAGVIVRCLTCRKYYFCFKCIKKWYYGMSKADIKTKCPVCRGCCTCKTCTVGQKNANAHDAAQNEDENGQPKDVTVKYATSPFSQLLPAINKFNVDQLDELEIEAKKQKKRVSCVHVQMLERGREEELNCNNCGDLILDFSRICPKCSYKLCITCCQKLRKEETTDKLKASDLTNCKSGSCKSTPLFHECGLTCPSKELGGCDNSSLGLVYLFPAGWSEALTISQEKRQVNASNSTHTESRDAVSSHCPSRANGKVSQLSSKPQEALSGFL